MLCPLLPQGAQSLLILDCVLGVPGPGPEQPLSPCLSGSWLAGLQVGRPVSPSLFGETEKMEALLIPQPELLGYLLIQHFLSPVRSEPREDGARLLCPSYPCYNTCSW